MERKLQRHSLTPVLAKTPTKILIVRLSAIGDIVMAAPVARALKEAYPNAEIHWLAQPECLSLIEDEPCVSKTFTWPRKKWATLWKHKKYAQYWHAVAHFKRHLKREKYDLAIDLQGLLKSGFLTWLSGAEYKVGLGSREGSQWLMNKVLPRNRGNQDLIGSEYRYIVEWLSGSKQYDLTLSNSEANTLAAAQKIDALTLRKPFLALCPFTTRPQKHWVDGYWQALIDQLLIDNEYALIMLGGPADKDYAEKLIGERKVHNFAGKTNLQQAGEVIRMAAGVIGVDTGLTHMGHAANTPTVAIFGSTRPYLDAEKDHSKIIYNDRHCAPCKRKPSCDGRFDCMQDITPELVLQHLEAAIAGVNA